MPFPSSGPAPIFYVNFERGSDADPGESRTLGSLVFMIDQPGAKDAPDGLAPISTLLYNGNGMAEGEEFYPATVLGFDPAKHTPWELLYAALHAFAENTDRPPLTVSIMDRDQFAPDWFMPKPEPS